MAFTGKASYTTLNEIAEDVSDMVALISVMETPFLDLIGDGDIQVKNVVHDWLEDALNPHVASLAAAATSDAGAAFGISVSNNSHIRVGMVLQADADGKSTHEQMLVVSKAGANTVYVDRAAAGTSATSHASGDNLRIVASAALEGDDAGTDTSTSRTRRTNFTQIIEKFVNISGTRQAVVNLGSGLENEVAKQEMDRLREAVRELENSVIAGRLLGNTVGTSTTRRTMAGLQGSITQTRSVGTVVHSLVDDLVQDVWAQGAHADLIMAGAQVKRRFHLFPGSAVRQVQNEKEFVRNIETYEGFDGTQRVMLNRYVDTNKILVGQSNLVRVGPLAGRSFAFQDLGKTGDATKRQLIGEYTVELGNVKGWAAGLNAA
jgi:hypothetical protein